MLALSFVNFCLRIITLGIYHFWGKTEVRRRIWSSARINGEPLAYTGTGAELCRGFLVVFAVVVIPSMLVSFLAVLALGPQSSLLGVLNTALYGFFFYLTGVAIHRAQRYRLARTQWRGIRGGMAGSAWSFAWVYFWSALLIPLTLGWIAPWRTTKLQGLLTNDMRFGNRPFRFEASSGPLYPRFAGLWLGSLLVVAGMIGAYSYFALTIGLNPEDFQPGRLSTRKLITILAVIYGVLVGGLLLYGILSAWYRAGMMNHFAAHTSYEGARFSARADGHSLIWLSVTNFLLVVLSLGLLGPIAQVRSARYFVRRLTFEGTLPVASIAQGAEDDIKRGEGLAQAFDVDAF